MVLYFFGCQWEHNYSFLEPIREGHGDCSIAEGGGTCVLNKPLDAYVVGPNPEQKSAWEMHPPRLMNFLRRRLVVYRRW